MKKKTFALVGLAALATLSLASCNKDDKDKTNNDDTTVTVRKGQLYGKAPADEVYTDLANKRLDVYVSYNGEQGITWRDKSYTNPVEGKSYEKGDLLPTWKAFQEKTKTEIHDGCNYNATTNEAIWTQITNNNMMSDNDNTQALDLVYTTPTNLQGGKFIDLLGNDADGKPYMDQMPNFKKWWNDYKSMQPQLLSGGNLNYTPYAEGFNDVERMFNMDTDLVRAVLDVTSFDAFDTTTTNGGATPSANVVQAGKYQPFMDANKNYPDAETKVKVLVNNAAKDITIKQTDNIIKQQNELLAAGCTGKQLAEQFVNYIDAAFGELIGEGKIYATRSEIFTSERAAYNADELVAIMRVIKANPGLITKNADNEIEPFIVRGQAANRVEGVSALTQIWGVHGITSINQNNYFSPDGKLANARTTKATYDSLECLAALYDEGLILGNFYYSDGTKRDTAYVDKYFKKNVEGAGYGFLIYDFAPATSYANDFVYGLGTQASKRTIEGYSTQGIMPVLSPLTYWATESNWKHTQDLYDKTGKTLCRFIESNKGLKSTSWGIPTTSDNIPGALRLMDYMFSPIGNMINCFGPEQYWAKPTEASLADGTDELMEGATLDDVLVSYSLLGENDPSPIISMGTKAMLATQSNFWTFMRGYLGATHGVGHIRHAGVDVQCCNEYAQKGLSNLKAACAADVVVQSRYNKYADYTWDTTAPKQGSHKDATNSYAGITEFWKQANCWSATPQGWVKVVVSGYGTDLSGTVVSKSGAVEYTYKDVQDQFDAFNKGFLYAFANELGGDGKYIPDYAKTTA